MQAGEQPGSWDIVDEGKVIQTVADEEFRFLVHWGADIFTDFADLKRTLDHSDDIAHERVFDMLIADLRARGVTFEVPSDPMTDQKFIALLTRVYDPGNPGIFPPEPEEVQAA